MPKPLRSESVTKPQDLQFKHFGVMSAGEQSKASIFTSLTLNILLLIIFVILGAAAKRTIDQRKAEELTFVTAIPKPPPPPKPLPPTPKVPKPPEIKPPEPKVVLPEVKIPPPPRPIPTPPTPKPLPAVRAAPPKAVVATAAPKPMPVHLGQSASVVNHDLHPSAVALGQANNPIAPSDRPAVSAINLGQRGLPGMPSSNRGGGPNATRVSLGSGQPNGSMNGTGSRGVVGVKMGVPGGTGRPGGNGIGNRPASVQLGQNTAPPPPRAGALEHLPVRQGPQVVSKPRPVYTAEATAMHIEGDVLVNIRVSNTGQVSVIGVTRGLGHGLDQSAIRAVEGTVFRPALDSAGHPTDWQGVVRITFQLAG